MQRVVRSTFVGILALASLTACGEKVTAPTAVLAPEAPSFSASPGTCTLASGKTASTGFDQYGYNRCAHQFVGTFGGWCAARGASVDCAGVAGDTHLVMKWNEEWDRGNATGWSQGPYTAWLDNEVNGAGFSEHFKTRWDATCTRTDPGCIWDQFRVLMDQGTQNGVHVWWAKLTPGGFGG